VRLKPSRQRLDEWFEMVKAAGYQLHELHCAHDCLLRNAIEQL